MSPFGSMRNRRPVGDTGRLEENMEEDYETGIQVIDEHKEFTWVFHCFELFRLGCAGPLSFTWGRWSKHPTMFPHIVHSYQRTGIICPMLIMTPRMQSKLLKVPLGQQSPNSWVCVPLGGSLWLPVDGEIHPPQSPLRNEFHSDGREIAKANHEGNLDEPSRRRGRNDGQHPCYGC